MGLLLDVYIFLSLAFHVDVDIIKNFLRTNIQVLHWSRLVDKLCSLANQKLPDCKQLLLGERLITIVDIARSVGKASYFEQLSDVLISVALFTFLI